MISNFDEIQKINHWIKSKVSGCKLIGLSEDGELFVEYENTEQPFEDFLTDTLKETFPLSVKKVVTVCKPSINQLEQIIGELNKVMSEEKKPRTTLLQIEGT